MSIWEVPSNPKDNNPLRSDSIELGLKISIKDRRIRNDALENQLEQSLRAQNTKFKRLYSRVKKRVSLGIFSDRVKNFHILFCYLFVWKCIEKRVEELNPWNDFHPDFEGIESDLANCIHYAHYNDPDLEEQCLQALFNDDYFWEK